MTENEIDLIGVQPARYISLNGGSPQPIDGVVIDEAPACVSVNGAELATFMATPRDLPELALGFLYNEEIITGLADVRACHAVVVDELHERRLDVDLLLALLRNQGLRLQVADNLRVLS